jgi:hypothetical protein
MVSEGTAGDALTLVVLAFRLLNETLEIESK